MATGPVLIVDDSESILTSLRQVIEQLGVGPEAIVTAERPAEAMKLFATHKPRIVFMDIDLAGERGDLAAQQMLEAEPSTKVIVMTGVDLEDARVRATVSAGAYDVIEKPLRLARIRQVFELMDSEERGYERL